MEFGESYCNNKAAKQFVVKIGNFNEDKLQQTLLDAPYLVYFVMEQQIELKLSKNL